jgi:hypothetical protein
MHIMQYVDLEGGEISVNCRDNSNRFIRLFCGYMEDNDGNKARTRRTVHDTLQLTNPPKKAPK